VTCLTECYDPADMETSLPGDIPARRSRASFWLAGVFLLCFTYFLPKPGDWNQNARLDLTLAMVNHGTVRTNPYHWQAGDDVLYKGHYYSNKAPGQSLVGVPVLLAYKGLLAAVDSSSIGDHMGLKHAGLTANYNFWLWQILESWYTVSLPTTLFLLLFFWFLGYFSRSVLNRAVLTLALGLATDMFSYSALFYPTRLPRHYCSAHLYFCTSRGDPTAYVAGRPAGSSTILGLPRSW
jgi:hypothetical protein